MMMMMVTMMMNGNVWHFCNKQMGRSHQGRHLLRGGRLDIEKQTNFVFTKDFFFLWETDFAIYKPFTNFRVCFKYISLKLLGSIQRTELKLKTLFWIWVLLGWGWVVFQVSSASRPGWTSGRPYIFAWGQSCKNIEMYEPIFLHRYSTA